MTEKNTRESKSIIEDPKYEPKEEDEKKLKHETLLKTIRSSIIGENSYFSTPFGIRKYTYCDYIASGKSLTFIEDYIRKEILPSYSNTHTTSSRSGQQTTYLRQEAREIIFNCVHGNKEDILIFTGNGATCGANVLSRAVARDVKDGQKLVVFISPYEHHANILPWRDRGASVITIPETDDGILDLAFLKAQLEKYSKDEKNFIVGSFSAASNVTGVLTDCETVTQIMHKYNGLAFFDFATCAPYVPLQMNSLSDSLMVKKDAIFFSSHKMLGGPGGPGILIAKKKLFKKKPPVQNNGGGVVYFVTEKNQIYVKDDDHRQEAGTPNILGCIRAGLAFYLRKSVGEDYIYEREHQLSKTTLKRLCQIENVVVLGPKRARRISVFSFLIRVENLFLHPNFVSKLLNDLFGIQTRAGCMCAGPYAQATLGMSFERAEEYEDILMQEYKYKKHEFLRPGFTRFNLNYFLTEETVDFVLKAVEFVAKNGWKFLVEYCLDVRTAEWFHFTDKKFHSRKWLHNISFANGKMEYDNDNVGDVTTEDHLEGEPLVKLYKSYFVEAEKKLAAIEKKPMKAFEYEGMIDAKVEQFRYFVNPSESYEFLTTGKWNTVVKENKIVPKEYKGDANFVKKVEKVEVEKMEEDEDDDDFFSSLPFGDMSELFEEKKDVKSLEMEMGWKRPSSQLLQTIVNGIDEFKMINDGDRLLLGLSGGKDSLTMLHCLKEIQKRAKAHGVNFEFGACTIDPKTSVFDPSPLKEYLAKLGVPYYYEAHELIEMAKEYNQSSICSWCSRMKRGILYKVCRRENYNVLVLAQHLDDLVESFLMSMFHNGLLRTMKVNYIIDEKDIRVIRPMVFCRERLMKQFARENGLPVVFESCPACFSQVPTERERVKKLMKEQEQMFPQIYESFKTGLVPLMKKDFEVEGKFHKKFKSRSQKDMESGKIEVEGDEEYRSVISGMPRKIYRQLKLLHSVQLNILQEEVQRRLEKKRIKKLKKKKDDN